MKTQTKRMGFSMIEVLVASTILIVIVMMMSMLFQQTSVAWRTGLMRAQGATHLRSYIGLIQREMNSAIDAKNLPEKLRYTANQSDSMGSREKQQFNSGELRFYAFSGTETNRMVCFVKLSPDGSMKKYEMSINPMGQWVWPPSPTFESESIISLSQKENSANSQVLVPESSFKITWPAGDDYDEAGRNVPNANRLPLFVEISASLQQEATLYEVGAESAGPDGVWDTKDDIRTWVK